MKKVLIVGVIVFALMVGTVAGSVYGAKSSEKKMDEKIAAINTDEEKIKDFYETENLVSVSPHTLRLEMDNGNSSFIVVDLRSVADYETEHMIGAVSIPGTTGDTNMVLEKFRALPAGKTIVTYCYSTSCMLSRKIGKILAEDGIYVKHLNIGWNEWRYDWRSWNAPTEWETTRPEDYVVSGKEPGTPQKKTEPLSCGGGELGC